MLLRFFASLIAASVQCSVLWLALFCAVRSAQHFDTSIHHHHGIAFGLLIYYLLLFTATFIVIINLAKAVLDRKWLTWMLIALALTVVFELFGGSPAEAPWRMLFLVLVITPLLLVTVQLNNFSLRLLLRLGRKIRVFPKKPSPAVQ